MEGKEKLVSTVQDGRSMVAVITKEEVALVERALVVGLTTSDVDKIIRSIKENRSPIIG
ncbi:MAG: hypothetical protein H0Z34_12425 [Brevibacillus sp.]|nr:hypothetical protein [Brevibacillus sp.]